MKTSVQIKGYMCDGCGVRAPARLARGSLSSFGSETFDLPQGWTWSGTFNEVFHYHSEDCRASVPDPEPGIGIETHLLSLRKGFAARGSRWNGG